MAGRLIRNALAICLAAAMAMPSFAADPAEAARYYEDGLRRFNDGDVQAAVVQLKNALQNDGKMLAAHLLLARALLALGNLPAAEASFMAARKLGVDASEVAIPLGRLYLLGGRPNDLLERVTEDGLFGATRAHVLSLRAMAHGQLGDYRASAESFEAARALAPESAAPLVSEIPILLAQGRAAEANGLARQALALEPELAEAWNMKASIEHLEGRDDAALQSYGKALELVPDHLDARVARAALLVDLARDQEALEDLDAIARKALGEPRAAYLRALVESRRGNRAAARAALAELTNLVDSLPLEWVTGREQMLMLGALAHHGLGEREKAKVYLNTLVSRYGRNLGARKLLARVFLEEGDGARALATVEPVLKAQPRDPQALFIAGEANMMLRRYATATEQLQAAADIGGAEMPALAALGFAQLGRGEADRGRATLEESFRRRPDNASVGFMLARIYVRSGESAKAVRVAESLSRRFPGNPASLNFVGVIRAAVGDLDGARRTYDETLKAFPDFAPARLNLAKLDIAAKRFDVARDALTAMLAGAPGQADVLYELGLLEVAANRPDAAAALFEKARAKQPKDPRPTLALIDLEIRAAHVDKALEKANALALDHPQNLTVLETMGRVQLVSGNRLAAKTTFMGMSRIAGFQVREQVRIGNLLLAAGYPEDALYAASKVQIDGPEGLEVQLLEGRAQLALQRLDQAQAIAARLQAGKTHASHGYSLAAHVASVRGQFLDAEKLYAKAFALGPSASTVQDLARARIAAGQLDKALKVLDAWLNDHPADWSVVRLAGDTAYQAGQLERARQRYAALVAAIPNDASAHNNLAMILLGSADPAAEWHARRAFQLLPASASVMDTLGWVLVRTGDADTGLRYLRDARLRAPQDPSVRAHLIGALVASGRVDEARRELENSREAGVHIGAVADAKAILERLEASPSRR